MGIQTNGWWVGPDGHMREAIKNSGFLGDMWGTLNERSERNLSTSRTDLARAYASAVWAYRCIKLRADAVAGVPLILRDKGGRQVTDHPLLVALQTASPPAQALVDLLRATEAAYNIWGVAYWLKVYRGGGPLRPLAGLRWLNPQTIEAQVDPTRGITAYKQTLGTQSRLLAPEDVIAFRNFDPLDDLGGLSPLGVAMSEINAELNAARYVAAFFTNDARPSGLLTTDQSVSDSDMARIETWWERLFTGVSKKWKTGIVGHGLRWQQISFSPNNLALAELRAEDRRAICAVFGIPAGMAGAWEATTYATARQQKASFYEDTMLPQMEYMAQVLNASLLPHYPDLAARGIALTWDTDSIEALRESATDKANRLAMLFQAGLISRDEARGELGMPDDTPGDEVQQEVEVEIGEDDARKALDGMLRDLFNWRQHALKRLEWGRPRQREFTSPFILPDLQRKIAGKLKSATTVAEVYAAFPTPDELAEALQGTAMGKGIGSRSLRLIPRRHFRLPDLVKPVDLVRNN